LTTEWPACYEDTRRVSPKQIEVAFRAALRKVPNPSKARVLDVGCGTGRLLRCLVPGVFSAKQVVGIDTSPSMLKRVRDKRSLDKVKLIETSIFDFTPTHQGRFDIIICHWFFHCVAPWHAAVLACLRLIKKTGVLVWLDEDGDLYRALDDLEAPAHSPAEPFTGCLTLLPRSDARARKDREVVPAQETAWVQNCGIETSWTSFCRTADGSTDQ